MNQYEPVPDEKKGGTLDDTSDANSAISQHPEQDELLKQLEEVEVLITYLKKEMNHSGKEFFTDAMAEAFRHHDIDGYAFQLLEEDHLREMELEINLGQKLHLLSKAQKVRRAVRMKRRNRQLFKIKCTLFTGTQSHEGTVSLSNSSLKFKFVEEQVETIKRKPDCGCWVFLDKFAYLKITGIVRALDHVDISMIEDVDCRTVDIIRKTAVKNAYCPDFCCCQSKPGIEEEISKNFVWISLAIPEEIYSAYMGGGETTSTLRVEIEDKEKAMIFKEKLIDAMEEVQFEEGARYSG